MGEVGERECEGEGRGEVGEGVERGKETSVKHNGSSSGDSTIYIHTGLGVVVVVVCRDMCNTQQ